jgi:RND family efflux transporter MFP subunit
MKSTLPRRRGTRLAWLPLLMAWPALAATEFDCLIEPSQTVDIRSPVSGLIEKVHVERGSVVRKGTVLVTLESTVERAAVELARFRSSMDGPVQVADSRVTHAERKLKRKTDMAEEKFASAQDRDDAEAERAIAVAEAKSARESKSLAALEHQYASAQLNQRVLRSPIDGVVVEQGMHAGELADASESKAAILKLAQTNPLRVKLVLPAAVYTRVKIGMKAEVLPEKPLGGRHVATVSSVDRIVDAASGTFQARLELNNSGNALPGGIKCRATLAGL